MKFQNKIQTCCLAVCYRMLQNKRKTVMFSLSSETCRSTFSLPAVWKQLCDVILLLVMEINWFVLKTYLIFWTSGHKTRELRNIWAPRNPPTMASVFSLGCCWLQLCFLLNNFICIIFTGLVKSHIYCYRTHRFYTELWWPKTQDLWFLLQVLKK